MDNGQSAGTGSINQDILNNFEVDNLNLNNDQVNWNTAPIERNNQNLGNTAMGSVEIALNPEIINPTEVSNFERMGQVVNLEMPPGVDNEKDMTPGQIAEQALSFNKKHIKTKERLDDAGVQEVKEAINKLNQDGNITDFYDKIRGENGMFTTNLENSYGEMAAWKGNKAA